MFKDDYKYMLCFISITAPDCGRLTQVFILWGLRYLFKLIIAFFDEDFSLRVDKIVYAKYNINIFSRRKNKWNGFPKSSGKPEKTQN